MCAYPHIMRNARMPQSKDPRAFTLTELLVVGLMIALVVLLLAPSLQAAAGRSETQVCLSNLRSLGMAVRLYAEQHNGILPGPLHPAVYHDVDEDIYPDPQRYLTWRLRSVLGDVITDRLVTCPTAAGVNPDANFEHFYEQTGRRVLPTHYVLNNYGWGGLTGTRATNPPCYFGFASWQPEFSTAPVGYGAVPNAEREWMIVDAWYRPRTGGFEELQQDGPFQTSWTGEALPNFAPHERRGSQNYSFTTEDARYLQSARIRNSKSDGITNTLFFDGHAAGVPSRTYTVGGWQFLYGFPGTVNPAQINPPPDSPVWDGIWR